MLRLLASLLSLLPLSACDPTWAVDVTVVVPVEIQKHYAGMLPAALYVESSKLHELDSSPVSGDTGPTRIAIVCAGDETEDLVFHGQLRGMGCSVETEVRAWLAPLPDGDSTPCGELPSGGAPRPGNMVPAKDAPRGEERAFAGQDSAECAGEAGAATVVLQVP